MIIGPQCSKEGDNTFVLGHIDRPMSSNAQFQDFICDIGHIILLLWCLECALCFYFHKMLQAYSRMYVFSIGIQCHIIVLHSTDMKELRILCKIKFTYSPKMFHGLVLLWGSISWVSYGYHIASWVDSIKIPNLSIDIIKDIKQQPWTTYSVRGVLTGGANLLLNATMEVT